MTMLHQEPSPVSLVPSTSPAQSGHFARPKLLPYHHNIHHHHHHHVNSSHNKIISQSNVSRQHSLPEETLGLSNRGNSFGHPGHMVNASPGKTVNLVIVPSNNESSSSTSTSCLTSSLPTASTSPASSHPWSEAGLFKSNIHLSHKLNCNHGSPPKMAVPHKSPISPNQCFYQQSSLIPSKISPGDFTDSYSFPITHSSPYQNTDYRSTPFNVRSEVRVKDSVDWSHVFGNSNELITSTSSSLLSSTSSCLSPSLNDSHLLVPKNNNGSSSSNNNAKENNGNSKAGGRPHLHALHKLRREIAKGLASSCRIIIRDTSKRSRPSLLSLGRDFFYRFHDREKFALSAFDFLDDYNSINDTCDDGQVVPPVDISVDQETPCNQMYLDLSPFSLAPSCVETSGCQNVMVNCFTCSPTVSPSSPPPVPPSTPRDMASPLSPTRHHPDVPDDDSQSPGEKYEAFEQVNEQQDQLATASQALLLSQGNLSSQPDADSSTRSPEKGECNHVSPEETLVPPCVLSTDECVNVCYDEPGETMTSFNLPSESTSEEDDDSVEKSLGNSDSSASCDLSHTLADYHRMDRLPDVINHISDDLNCLLADFDGGKETTDVSPITDLCLSQIEESFRLDTPPCVPIYTCIDSTCVDLVNDITVNTQDDVEHGIIGKCHSYPCDLSPESASDVDMTPFWKLVHLNSEMEESEIDQDKQQIVEQQQQQQLLSYETPQAQQSTAKCHVPVDARKYKGKDKYSCNRGKSRKGKRRQRQKQKKNHVDLS